MKEQKERSPLHAVRIEAKMSVQDFAKALGIHRVVLWSLETGKQRTVKKAVALKLADLIGKEKAIITLEAHQNWCFSHALQDITDGKIKGIVYRKVDYKEMLKGV